ncbi:MAG: NBR1-Ig-like domain-containing protein [Ignavibacteria bacterium]
MNLTKKIKLIAISMIMLFAINVRSQIGTDLITNTPDNAALITHNMPSVLKSGQVYPVTITMRNIGLNTWKMRDNYQLSLFTATDNVYQSDVWGIRHINLPYDVLPTETVTFNFDISSPRERGTFNSRWSMSHNGDYFGEKTTAMIEIVDGADLPINYYDVNNNAEYINQSIPSTMMAGQTYKIWVNMRNTGKTTWNSNSENLTGQYRLGFISDLQDGNKYINLNGLPVLLNNLVAPGESGMFEFTLTAPMQPGSYYFQTMMMQNNSSFGQKSNGVWVNVEGGGNSSSLNNSSFITQKISKKMTGGREYKVSVTMSNNGQTAWTKDRYALALVDSKMLPISFNPWDLGYVEVPETVLPGSLVTFEFNIKAPTSPNYYPVQFSIMESGRPFGTSTPVVDILVEKSKY